MTPSLANYSFSPLSRSISQVGNHTDAAFTGSANGDIANPLDTPEYFVRQHMLMCWAASLMKAASIIGARRSPSAAMMRAVSINGGASGSLFLHRAGISGHRFVRLRVVQSVIRCAAHVRSVSTGPQTRNWRPGADRQSQCAGGRFRVALRVQTGLSGFHDQPGVRHKLYTTAGLPFSMERILAVNRMQSGATRAQILEGVIADTEFARADTTALLLLRNTSLTCAATRNRRATISG